jgi:hypothetical protein
MNCDTATKNFSLFLYGELAFEAEKAIHRALDEREQEPPAALLARCRRDLSERLEMAGPREPVWWKWFRGWPALARPAGALALVALGFFSARWTAAPGAGPGSEPVVSRVRYVQPESSGKVQLVIEETRQRMLSGDPGDAQIHRLLLAAARESSDAGLRAESMDILGTRPSTDELRGALVFALEHDPNPGVRLKALGALKPYAGTAEVRGALAKVLLADDNPGMRTQAIDLLMQKKEDAMVGLLQELVQRESNTYVRQRCQRALQEMDASVGTF